MLIYSRVLLVLRKKKAVILLYLFLLKFFLQRSVDSFFLKFI